MAINKITNTPITTSWYGSLALVQARHQSHGNCVIQPDGTLWVAVPDPAEDLHLFRSTDNGFSWTEVLNATGVPQRTDTGNTTRGPLNFILIDEVFDNLDLIGMEWESIGSTFDLNRSRYALSEIETDSPSNTLIDSIAQASNGTFDIGYSHRNAIFVFNDGVGNLSARLLSPRTTSYSSAVDFADNVAGGPGPACVVDEDGFAYCLYFNDSTDDLKSQIFTSSAGGGTWQASGVIVDNMANGEWPDDMVISRDGYGTLLALWAERNTADTQTTVTYATSTNSGINWSNPTAIARESGYEQYLEDPSGLPVSYLDAIAGINGGFIITYCDKETSDEKAHTFIRQLTTSDGVTYTLGDQKEIGTRYDGNHVAGAHFFKPTTTKLMDLSDPGLVRIAYTVGQGDDPDGDQDLKPVTFGQELLSEVALPSSLSTDTGTYTQDTAGSGQLLVQFNIVGSPQDNVDFNALGMTGEQTKKYTAAFNKIGTNLRFLKHEPTQISLMNDRSSYDPPTETRSLAIIDPINYSFPAPELDTQANINTWVERDTRKIYLPPDFHLARTFVVNNGGYLKRTVWLTEFDGNQYEISQVVPHFISNQICYYEANAYVVGPSRDPFSRTVLPSET